MKLAEALIIRADLQNRITAIETRIKNNITVQSGQQPAEDPKELFALLDSSMDELEKLIAKINLSNASIVKDGVTMTELLARRDRLKMTVRVYGELVAEASVPAYRTRAAEIVILPTVSAKELQKQLDGYSAELRRLDIEIQSMNWTSDLID